MQNLPSILTPDFGLIFWMSLAFLTILGVLLVFVFPMLLNSVEERKNFIDESLKNAREANEKLANIKVESEQLLKQAREQQAEIIQSAMATREDIIKKAKDEAQVEGAKLIGEAKKQIQAEKEIALRDIREQVAELSLQVAEKVVRRQIDNNTEQEKFIQRLLDEVVVNK